MLQPEFEKSTGFEPSSLDDDEMIELACERDIRASFEAWDKERFARAIKELEQDIKEWKEEAEASRSRSYDEVTASIQRWLDEAYAANRQRATAKRMNALQNKNPRLKQALRRYISK